MTDNKIMSKVLILILAVILYAGLNTLMYAIERSYHVGEINELKIETIKYKEDALDSEMKTLPIDLAEYIRSKYTIISKEETDEVVKSITNEGISKEISPSLILAMIETESSMNPNATSKKKARGLMQVMPFWIKKTNIVSCKEELYEIDKNIAVGTGALRIHLNESSGELDKALLAYSGGSKDYVRTVFLKLAEFEMFRVKKVKERLTSNPN